MTDSKPRERVNLNCPDCIHRVSKSMAQGNCIDEIICTCCGKCWQRDHFIEQHTGISTVNPDEPEPSMKVPCSYPDCPGFKTIDPTECQEMPIRWLCQLHSKFIFLECHEENCDMIGYFLKSETPDFYWCPKHTDGTTPQPLKPGEHPKTTLKCAHEGCTAGRDYDVADQIPAHYWCEKHGPYYQPKPVLHTPPKRARVTIINCDFPRCTHRKSFLGTDRVPEKWCCPKHVSSTEHDYDLLKKLEDRLEEVTRELRAALEEINPFLKALHAGDTIEMARTLGVINRAREKYPL